MQSPRKQWNIGVAKTRIVLVLKLCQTRCFCSLVLEVVMLIVRPDCCHQAYNSRFLAYLSPVLQALFLLLLSDLSALTSRVSTVHGRRLVD